MPRKKVVDELNRSSLAGIAMRHWKSDSKAVPVQAVDDKKSESTRKKKPKKIDITAKKSALIMPERILEPVKTGDDAKDIKKEVQPKVEHVISAPIVQAHVVEVVVPREPNTEKMVEPKLVVNQVVETLAIEPAQKQPILTESKQVQSQSLNVAVNKSQALESPPTATEPRKGRHTRHRNRRYGNQTPQKPVENNVPSTMDKGASTAGILATLGNRSPVAASLPAVQAIPLPVLDLNVQTVEVTQQIEIALPIPDSSAALKEVPAQIPMTVNYAIPTSAPVPHFPPSNYPQMAPNQMQGPVYPFFNQGAPQSYPGPSQNELSLLARLEITKAEVTFWKGMALKNAEKLEQLQFNLQSSGLGAGNNLQNFRR